MDWGTIIIIAVLMFVVFVSILSGKKHFKGQGGCCGGSDDLKPAKKKLKDPMTAKKIITISGMHCEHCKNSVTEQINKIDGASAHVSLRKKNAVVLMSRNVTDQELQRAVENAGFTVVKIETEAV